MDSCDPDMSFFSLPLECWITNAGGVQWNSRIAIYFRPISSILAARYLISNFLSFSLIDPIQSFRGLLGTRCAIEEYFITRQTAMLLLGQPIRSTPSFIANRTLPRIWPKVVVPGQPVYNALAARIGLIERITRFDPTPIP